MVLHFLPRVVDLHNYSAANSLQQKVRGDRCMSMPHVLPHACPMHASSDGAHAAAALKHACTVHKLNSRPPPRAPQLYNWSTLNSKVFKRLGFQLSREEQMK